MGLKIDAKIDQKIDLIFNRFLIDFGLTFPKDSKNLPKNDTKKESENVTKKARKMNL